jgi:ribosome modulation factor
MNAKLAPVRPDENTAFGRGYYDRLDGFSEKSNPYDGPQARQQWTWGWEAADKNEESCQPLGQFQSLQVLEYR